MVLPVRDLNSNSVDSLLGINCLRLPQLQGDNPPYPKKIRAYHVLHGDTRPDDYDWMRHKNDPDLIRFLEESNVYSESHLKQLKPVTNSLFKEMASRLESDYDTLPFQVGEFYYFKRFKGTEEFPRHCRKPVQGGETVELLDVNQLAAQPHVDVKEFIPSPNGLYAVMTIDTDGSHYGYAHLLNCRTQKLIDSEQISDTNGNFVWDAEGNGFWYVKLNECKRFAYIYYHKVGTNPIQDKLIFFEKDGGCDLYLCKDKLNEYLLVSSLSKSSSCYMCMLLREDQTLEVILPREEGLLYTAVKSKDQLYIIANQPSKNNSLFVLKNSKLEPICLSGKNMHIDRIEVFENYVVIKKRVDGLLQFDVFDEQTKQTHSIPLPQNLCDCDFYHNTRFNDDRVLISMCSPILPMSIYEWDMRNRNLTLRFQETAGGFAKDSYTSQRLFAYNGETAVPISLFYKKDLPLDRPHPLRLYCYGAYGSTTDPAYTPITAAFLERNCIFAIAHVRGSGDLGQYWYEDGKLEKKMNTFTDFIACAEALINKGFTSHEQLAIEGGSAGGLVIATVMNMRPDLCKMCLIDVAFLDVVTTMSDPQIPLTEQEWKEYGNPHFKEQYDWLKRYSPYDNIRAAEYPACLITAGFNDAQVLIREQAKYAAKLREFSISKNLLLFIINMTSGHNGNAGRFGSLAEIAASYAFMLKQIGAITS